MYPEFKQDVIELAMAVKKMYSNPNIVVYTLVILFIGVVLGRCSV